MDPSFIPIEAVPSKTPFGLDQLRRSYKTSLSATDAIIAAPNIGDPDEVFEKMFLSSATAPESSESATRVDLIYMGCFQVDGEDNPILPDPKNATGNPVQTATTYTSSAIFPAVAAVPASLQYHAHETSIIEFSTSDTSATDPPDPPAITVDDLITWTLAAEQPAGSFPGIAAFLLSDAFVQAIVATENAEEIVPANQYFQITKRKTMQLFPYAPPS